VAELPTLAAPGAREYGSARRAQYPVPRSLPLASGNANSAKIALGSVLSPRAGLSRTQAVLDHGVGLRFLPIFLALACGLDSNLTVMLIVILSLYGSAERLGAYRETQE
jgi:hypothetical protein